MIKTEPGFKDTLCYRQEDLGWGLGVWSSTEEGQSATFCWQPGHGRKRLREPRATGRDGNVERRPIPSPREWEGPLHGRPPSVFSHHSSSFFHELCSVGLNLC